MSTTNDDTRWQRIKEIFEEAIELPAAERPAFLDEVCGGDAGLRAEVEEMIAADTDAGDFMEEPAVAAGPDSAAADDAEFGEGLVGKRIGQYLLQRAVSAGGMGVVYEALQEKPRRTVAVKLMREGLATRSALRRFEYESQILARLRHPGIAQVIEAGTHRTADGTALPYFVMEFIPEARALTDYAREKRLGTRDRLDLFMQVCAAVHHGHQKGVIHRDLKPSNILVDAQGQVKIIDFGIARATDSDIKLTTQQTDVGQLIGTVQYMSPEQCKADPDALDIRSDVYALGVVLYELLCEELPYDVRQAAIFEATRLIREEPPKKPSTVNKTLRGDVETIVLKALEKERERRYQSIAAFEDDIKRYLRGEVILARPAGPGRRLWKQIKRNPVVSASVAVAFLALISFVLYLQLWSLPQLREERNKAEKERTAALEAKAEQEREALNAQEINTFLEEMLSAADPYKVGYDVKVLDMLKPAAERIDKEFPDRPEIEASLRTTLGTTYLNNGMYEEAEQQYRAALAIHERISGKDDKATVESLNSLANALELQGRYDEAESLRVEVLDSYRRVLGNDHIKTYGSMNNLGLLLLRMARFDDAEPLFVKALEGQRRLLGDTHVHTLSTLSNLGSLYRDLGRYEEAEQLLIEVLDGTRNEFGNDNPLTFASVTNLAGLYTRKGDFEKAGPLLVESLEGRRRILDAHHPDLLTSMDNLAVYYLVQGRLDEAEPLMAEALEKRRKVLGKDHPLLFISLNNLAGLYFQQGRFEKAEPLLMEALEGRRRTLAPDHPDILNSLNSAAVLNMKLGHFDEAQFFFKEALEKRRKVLGESHPDTVHTLANYVKFLAERKRFEEAAPLARELMKHTPEDDRNRGARKALVERILDECGEGERGDQ